MSKKSQQLREIINSNNLEFLMEAHNGLSAKIVEEAGFSGIWASGLSISASLGVRDNNEASWTQILEVVEFMSDATDIPILLDGDTGFGNFNNVRRLIKKLEQRDIAGVCIEDKMFPKKNSFIPGASQPLAEIDEFCGKIKAAKDTQFDSNFNVIARTEALIAGHDMEEALKRCDFYSEAGADAIVIHSKKDTADEIITFMSKWTNKCPVVIIPTTYHQTPTETYAKNNISIAIWANHLMRSYVKAIQHTAQTIFETKSTSSIQKDIVDIKEVFRLQKMDEFKIAEKKYLPKNR